jgi:hypothetical protein
MPNELDLQNGNADDDKDAPSFPSEDVDGARQVSGHRRRKRKRSEDLVDADELADAADEPALEIAESDDDDFEDDLASQESSSDSDDDAGDESSEAEDDSSSDSDVVRRRRISAGDTRYGGQSQRAGWATRRLKAAQAAAQAAAAATAATPRPKKTRGMRSARGSWLGTGGRPPKRGR